MGCIVTLAQAKKGYVTMVQAKKMVTIPLAVIHFADYSPDVPFLLQKRMAELETILHVNSFKETRQSKQLHPKTTPFFLKRKNELPRAGFEPATFCVLGERSTN